MVHTVAIKQFQTTLSISFGTCQFVAHIYSEFFHLTTPYSSHTLYHRPTHSSQCTFSVCPLEAVIFHLYKFGILYAVLSLWSLSLIWPDYLFPFCPFHLPVCNTISAVFKTCKVDWEKARNIHQLSTTHPHHPLHSKRNTSTACPRCSLRWWTWTHQRTSWRTLRTSSATLHHNHHRSASHCQHAAVRDRKDSPRWRYLQGV